MMRIQFLNGGLANQTFQYLFARYYELSHPGEIMYLDDSYFAINTVHNGYELDKVFGVKPHKVSECFSQKAWNLILEERKKGKSIAQILSEGGMDIVLLAETDNYKEFNPFTGKVFPIPCNEYYPEILDLPFNVYYHGYWINYNWFAKYQDVFCAELQFPPITDECNNIYLNQIKMTQSVSIHIRRGDYVTLGWNLDNDTYMQLCKIFISNYSADWTIFVFSDDIAWCREHQAELGLTLFKNIIFVEGNLQGNNYIDMQLMSKCKGMIMSNSAFCYLAALLNCNKDFMINPTTRQIR